MPRTTRSVTLLVALLLGPTLVVAAPRAGAEEAVTDSVPSFGESPGCGALDGVGGPRMSRAGDFWTDLDEPVYGPWGDYFGRTIGEIRSQLVIVHLPGQPKDLYIHERVLPAFELMLDNLAAYQPDGESYQIRSDTWSYNPATIPPTTKLSFHGIGASIDVNSATNPYSADNILITDMPTWFVDAWRDAGWCWGGDWQTIKDPMHFSWMGPIHTPGYEMLPPQLPDVSFSDYSDNPSFPEHSYDVVFDGGGPTGRHFAVDLDANGAADIVRLREQPSGTVALEVSRARHRYTRSADWAVTTEPPADAAAPVSLADVTGDARPDLVYLLEQPNGTLELEVFPLVQSGDLVATTIPTSVPAVAGDVYLFDDFDMDGESDLYVIRPGSPGTVEVWLGPDFATAHVSVSAELAADSRYATGDRDFDGTADLYVLGADGSLDIMIGSTPAFEAVGSISAGQMALDPTDHRFFVDDLDGDGHPDLLLVDPDGDLRIRRGGFSTHDPDVWFVVEGEIGTTPPPDPTRIAGEDRYGTAVAASKVSHPDGAEVVYVAVGTNFPDGIAAGPAAAAEGAPILLVTRDTVPAATQDELQRLDPNLVVVLGGPAAVSDRVIGDLTSILPSATIDRRWGADRYETAVAVNAEVFEPGVDTLFVASGEVFADALVTAPWAAAGGEPLLLTRGGSLPDVVRAEIQRLGPSSIILVGGTSAVSTAVETQLAALASVQRISGANRYALSVGVSEDSYPGGASIVYIAVGSRYPDALAAGPFTTLQPGPLLLVDTDSLPAVVAAELARLGPHEVVVMGGPAAVSDSVVAQIASYQVG